MSFEDDLQQRVADILNAPWDLRDGRVVPSTDDVKLRDGGVNMTATFLYADLANSTNLQKSYKATFAAKAMRMYLYGATSIIRKYGGSIRSFDGDRVMGVFAGDRMRNDAVRASYSIHWLVTQVIAPLVKDRHERNGTTVWTPTHGIGVDTSETLIARAGIHNSNGETNHNDLIFAGRAPSVAAKLSALRGDNQGPITITHDVHRYLNDAQTHRLNGEKNIWSAGAVRRVGPYSLTLHRSTYWRSPNEK